jgi:integrase
MAEIRRRSKVDTQSDKPDLRLVSPPAPMPARPAKARTGRRPTGNVISWTNKDGDVGYGVRFLDQDGIRRYERCGLESQGWSRRRAEIARDEFVEEVALGTYRPTVGFARDESVDPLFEDFAREILAAHAIEVAPSSRRFYENLFRHHLLPEFGHLRLSQITTERIDEYRHKRIRLMKQLRRAAEAGDPLRGRDGRHLRLSERTINHSISLLGLILQQGVRRRTIALTVNEARDRQLHVKVPKKTVRDWLERDEVWLLLDAAQRVDCSVRPETARKAAEVRRLRDECGMTVQQVAHTMGLSEGGVCYLYERRSEQTISMMRTVIATLVASGVRNGEACLLRPIDLDFVHGKIRIEKSKTPMGVREVSMTPWLARQLKAYVASLGPDYDLTGPLFRNARGHAFNKDTLNKRIKAVYEEAVHMRIQQGRPPLPTALSAHVFRRTCITLMLEAGAPPSYVQLQVGHEDARTTTDIYSRVLQTRNRHDFGRAFDDLLGVRPLEMVGRSSYPDRDAGVRTGE